MTPAWTLESLTRLSWLLMNVSRLACVPQVMNLSRRLLLHCLPSIPERSCAQHVGRVTYGGILVSECSGCGCCGLMLELRLRLGLSTSRAVFIDISRTADAAATVWKR
ncbi:hypothetical protein BKA81DRAFT_373405 [Phyllosticta paracitricarpa]